LLQDETHLPLDSLFTEGNVSDEEKTKMVASVSPTEADVRAFVYKWFRLLDTHAPQEQVVSLVSDTELHMQFPEGPLNSPAEFANWYRGVTSIFFDETHEFKMLTVDVPQAPKGSGFDPRAWQSNVALVVRWQAHRWKPPAAKSDYLAFDAWQRWVIKLKPGRNDLVVTTYIVDVLEPLQGSAAL
jgi:hypothetical protein